MLGRSCKDKHTEYSSALLPHWLVLLVIACSLAACVTSGTRIVDHAFGFDILTAVPSVEVIDYRYGDSKLPTRAPEWAVAEGRSLYFNNVHGPMLVGDLLYVKWRIKATGQIYEDTVDLRERLPRDMKDQRVHFDIKGPQLYIYLISPELLPQDMPSNDLRIYRHQRVITIYPDHSKK